MKLRPNVPALRLRVPRVLATLVVGLLWLAGPASADTTTPAILSIDKTEERYANIKCNQVQARSTSPQLCPPVLDETGTNELPAEPQAEDAQVLAGLQGASASSVLSDPTALLSSNQACKTGGWYDGYNWVAIRNDVRDYTIGNCHDRWHMNVSKNGGGFDGGYVAGEFNACGYVEDAHTVTPAKAIAANCPDPNWSLSEFMRYANCAPGKCKDGKATPMATDCPEYANVRPWTSAAPTGLLRTVNKNARASDGTYRLKWRYLAKGSDYFMVKDTEAESGTGRWVFVPASCLQQPVEGYDSRYTP
jgi:hypothetical protein